MKRLRPIFNKLKGILLKEIPHSELEALNYLAEYEVSYYEAMLLRNQFPISPREALDCIDFVVLHERDPRYYEFWPRMIELYRRARAYVVANTGFQEDPIFGQGYYAIDRIKPRYEFKQRVLRGNAERLGLVVV